MRVNGIRWDEKHIGAVQARLTTLKDNGPVQAKRYLRCMVPVSSRRVSGRQHQQTVAAKHTAENGAIAIPASLFKSA